MTVTDTVRPSKFKEGHFHVPKKVEDMERYGDGLQIFRQELEKKQKRKLAGGGGDRTSKSVDAIHFPGFYAQEMLEFPGQYEAPVLMNAVTQRQSFNAGFMKFWKRIFLSEASVAIMQDTFWWIFLDKFEGKHNKQRENGGAYASNNDDSGKQPKGETEGGGGNGNSRSASGLGETEIQECKDKLFNRIADCFVTMFFSIHPDMKDKFLNVYPNVLAQTLFASYVECFPMSKILFDVHFKEYVANICFQWISGIKPSPLQTRDWKLDKLMAVPTDNTANSVLDSARSGGGDIEISGSGKSTPKSQFKRASGQNHANKKEEAFEDWEATKQQQSTKTVRGIPKFTRAKPNHQSMPAAGSDQMERLPFTIYGRSPLVAHWLHSKSLAGKSQHTTGPNTMVRVQVEKLNQETLTLQDVINEVNDNAMTRKKEMTRIEKETQREIRRIDENLKAQLKSLKNLEQKLAKNSLPKIKRRKDSNAISSSGTYRDDLSSDEQ
ncbi:uncharacterized protein LOC142350001 isoform X2 [Convolutriloba macropyga]|uniref:uncharacterized protein LOC142350001 isoform X2 n=1 Tax=Convolutriloba macropyga TaxID=536237 RepID=UPI003F521395